MGLKTIAKRTGMARSSVQLAIKSLRIEGIISQEKNGGWSFRKDYDKWAWGASPLAPGGQPTGQKGPAHWPRGASPLAKRGQPTGPLNAIFSTERESPKEIKTYIKKERKIKGPSAPELSKLIDNLCTTKDEIIYRRCKVTGQHRNRQFVDIPASDAEWMIENKNPQGDDLAGLRAIVKIKQDELRRTP
jgi:hypothetical protein